jgi:hypothetical protein
MQGSGPADQHPAAGSRKVAGVLALVALIALCILRSATGTRLDSFTVDEPWHIVAGTSYARTGDFSLNPEHPPLVKVWVGATMPEAFKLRAPTLLSEKAQERDWVEETMFVDNDPQRAQADARAAMWGLHGVLLLALALLLWRAGNWMWAAGSLAILAIEPTVGAHLPVVMTDLPLALTLGIAAIAAGLLASTWQWRWVFVCGAAIGLALGAKHSALAALLGIAVMLSLAAVVRPQAVRWRGVLARALKLMTCAAVALIVLWGQYGFHFHAAPDGSNAFNRPMADKIAELGNPVWRDGIAAADRFQLLPRAYLWGLADTVRTGMEGRGISEHLVWGTIYQGKAPWFSWPAIVAAKLPLGLLALSVFGALLLWRAHVPATARWAALAMLGACAMHLAALIVSGSIWGGVRHALPILVGLCILGGGAFALAWQRRSHAAGVVCAALLVAAIAMTVREPRLWEYHNELVGGSANGYRYFANEGLDLGQRFAEIRDFHDRVIAPDGQPVYSGYWMGEIQTRAAKLNVRRRVESLDDTNVDGLYEGWFIYTDSDTLPRPSWDWNPDEVFKDLTLVQQLGHVGIWKGRQRRPQTRASGMSAKVIDYIYKEDGNDWALVAARLEEVAALMPQKIDTGIELGNAYLRLGKSDQSIAAYRRLLENDRMPVDAGVAGQLRAQIQRIATSDGIAMIEPLRNPWLE